MTLFPPVIDGYTGRELKPGDVYGRLRPLSEVNPRELGSTDQAIFLGLARAGTLPLQSWGYTRDPEAEFYYQMQELHRDGTTGRTGWWPVLPKFHIRRRGFRNVIVL